MSEIESPSGTITLASAQAVVESKVHPRVTKESIEDKIERVSYIAFGTGTFAVIEMANGFEFHGYSNPADRRNYDKDVGERFAYEDAFKKIWSHEGYLLREQLAREEI